VPLAVQSNDQNVVLPTERVGLFGRGADSAQSNPQHTYDLTGTSTVALIVTGSLGTDVEVKPSHITVNEPVRA
jgi:PKD repeat protein